MMTRNGPITFGTMWRMMILVWPSPSARAGDAARERYAAELVRLAPTGPARRFGHRGAIVGARVVRRDPFGEDPAEPEDQHQHEADRADRLATEKGGRNAPEAVRRAASLVDENRDSGGGWGDFDGHRAGPFRRDGCADRARRRAGRRRDCSIPRS